MEQFLPLVVNPLIVSFLLAFLISPVIIKLAPFLRVIDNPEKRYHPATLHIKPIARGGGIALYFAIFLTSLFFIQYDPRLTAIMIGALIVVLIGYMDDRGDVNPYIRLLAQLLAALVVVASGIGISYVTNPVSGGVIDLSGIKVGFEFLGEHREIWILSVIFAFLWIVGLMNAVSWASGVDGQLSGFVVIAALVVAVLSLRYSTDPNQWSVTILAAIVSGAYLGFLPWHIYPQKIMPGFGGATLAGFMLAIISILATAKVGTLLVVLALPIIDASYTFLRRVLSGKSPVWGDRGHLHHRLLDAGWSKPQVAFFYWGATLTLGVMALFLNARDKFYTIVGIVLLVGGALLWIKFLSESSKRHGQGNGSKI